MKSGKKPGFFSGLILERKVDVIITTRALDGLERLVYYLEH
jgi:hypothetical protein